MNKNQTKMFTN